MPSFSRSLSKGKALGKLLIPVVFLGFMAIALGISIPVKSADTELDTDKLHKQIRQEPVPFLYLPFRVIEDAPDYMDTMTSVFDHSNPSYTRSDNKIIMFNGGIFDDNCWSVDYNNQPVSNCGGPLQSFTDETLEFPRQYYNGHAGYDWAIEGDVVAAAGGVIDFVGWWLSGPRKCLGYMIIIDHQNDYRSIYGHMQNNSSPFSKGQWVSAGQTIGTVGNTTGCGTSTGTHLHFQVEHWQWQNEDWHLTDPFGWDYSAGSDPLIQYNGETSVNLWVNGSPTSYGGGVGALPSVPLNSRYMGGAYIVDSPPNPDEPPPPPTPAPNDTIPPSASGFSATPSGGIANLSTSGVQDNPGGSGVREVRFSAKFNNQWVGIGVDTTAPYSLAWDMCASGVPDGDVELGMEVWDNANNVWIWSQHSNNPHITKNHNCAPPPAQEGVTLYTNTGLSGNSCYITQDQPSIGNHCGSGWNDNAESVRVQGPYYFALFRDDGYGGGTPYTGNPTGDLPPEWRNQASSIRIRRNSPAAFTLFDLGDYNGQSWASDRTIFDMGHWDWNDRAESIQVASGYGLIVCEHSDFKGGCGRATGPAQWSDINALAQGLRNGVSSVRVCSSTCPEAGPPPTLNYPINNQTVDAGQAVIFSWGGPLNQFYVEVWGGGLGSTLRHGWTSNAQWNAGVLPESATQYHWQVKGWRGYGETGWATGSFYIATPDTTPPSGVMSAPHFGEYQGGPTVTLAATASDSGSGVNRLEFYVWLNDRWEFLGTDSSAPYAYTWDISSVPEGGIWASADVIDNAENHSGLIWEPNWSYFIIDKSPPSSAVIPLPATQSSPQFTVRWSGNDNFTPNDLIFYDVQYQLNCTGSWVDWLVMNIWEGATFNGEEGQIYCFRSRAYDLAGNIEAWPDSADTQTMVIRFYNTYLPIIFNNHIAAKAIMAPSNLQATPLSQSEIKLSWQDNSSNEDGFEIERRFEDSASWIKVGEVGAGTISFSDMNLLTNTVYYYRVRAYNAWGFSDYSQPISATTTASNSIFWSVIDPLPSSISEAGITIDENRIYITGGRPNKTSVYYANVNTDGSLTAWQSATSLPRDTISHQLVVNQGHLFILGGYQIAQKNVISAPLTPNGSIGAWTVQNSLPDDYYRFASATNGEYIYVIGGFSDLDGPCAVCSSAYRTQVYADGSVGNWESLTPLPIGLHAHAVVLHENFIYVIGGMTALTDDSIQDEVYYTQIQANGTINTWTQTTSLPVPLQGHSATSWQGSIVVTGGRTGVTPDSTVNTTYIANLNADGSITNWISTNNIPQGQAFHGSLSYGLNIYVIGGPDAATVFHGRPIIR